MDVAIPHAPPMRLIGNDLRRTDDGWLVDARVLAGPALDDVEVRPGYLIEMGAQAAAAVAAVQSGGGMAKAGMLVAVADWRFENSVTAGAMVTVRLRSGPVFGGLHQYTATIHRSDDSLAAMGTLTVALRDDA